MLLLLRTAVGGIVGTAPSSGWRSSRRTICKLCILVMFAAFGGSSKVQHTLCYPQVVFLCRRSTLLEMTDPVAAD